MSKRAWARGKPDSPLTKRIRCSPDGSILVASLGSGDRQPQSQVLKNRHSEELEQRLWIESDPSLSQQIVKALAESPLEASALCALLQRYYISCSNDSTKICVLSCLLRSSRKFSSDQPPPLLESAEAMLLSDLERENPVLRMWVLRFLQQGQQPEQQDRFVSEVLSRKFFDPHELMRRFSLEAAIALPRFAGASMEILNTAALQLLREPSESVRILAMKLLRRWVVDVQAMKEEESLESRINYCYLLMCTMVTDLSMRARKEACGVLGSMTMASYKVKHHSLGKKSVLLAKDDPGLLDGRDAPVAMAAGAFVSAVEDEFPEVRSAAIQALTSLSLQCTELIAGVLALLLDMLNDQHVGVRMDSIRALCELAERGVLSLEQKHLQLVCDVLKDSEEVRKLGRRLLSCIKLPTVSVFKLVVQTLLSSLDHHPQDQEDIYKSLLRLGNGHATYVELLTDELSKEIKLLLSGEKGLDGSKVKALLNLCLGSLQSASCISSWLPSELVTCAKLTGLSHHQGEAVSSRKLEVLLVIQRALSVKPSAEDKLRALSACRKALTLLETSPEVNLGALYVEFLISVAKLSRSATGDTCEKLVRDLGSIRARFSGFSATGAVQLLELDTYTILMRQGSGSDIRIISQLSSILEESKKYPPVESLKLLPLVEEQLRSSSFSDSKRMKALTEAAKSFWPSHDITGGGIEEMRGCVKLPASDFEHKLRFIGGLPFQFMVTGELQHITAGSRIWLEMRFEDFPCQYVCLRGKSGESLRITEEVVYHNMPFVAAGILRVRMVVELQVVGTAVSVYRGPQASVTPISAEHLLYLQAVNV